MKGDLSMTKWLKERLPELFRLLPSDFQPFRETAENEEVLGVVSPEIGEMARLFIWLRDGLLNDIEKHNAGHTNDAHTEDQCLAFQREATKRNDEIDAVRDIVSASIWHELNTYPRTPFSVRKNKDGALVVATPREKMRHGMGIEIISVGSGIPQELAEAFGARQGRTGDSLKELFRRGFTFGNKPH